MDPILHNIDETFNEAYVKYEEVPSGDVWENLNAALIKQDSDKYRRMFIGWKRIALLLLFTLSGLIIYESGVLKKEKVENVLFKNIKNKDSVVIKSGKADFNVRVNNNIRQNKITKDSIDIITWQSRVKKNETNKLIEYGLSSDNITLSKEELISPDQNINKHNNNKFIDADFLNIDSFKDANRNSIPPLSNLTEVAELENIDGHNFKPLNNFDLSIKTLIASNAIFATPANANKSNIPVKIHKPNYSITAFVSNEWGQYQLNNDVPDMNANIQDVKDKISKREKHEFSVSSGIMASKQFSRQLGIKTGLIYSNTAISINPQQIYASQQPGGKIAYKYIVSSGYAYLKPQFGLPPSVGDSIQSAAAQHNIQSIALPILIMYNFDFRKFSIIPSAGITANFITRATVQTEIANAVNRETVTINGLSGMRYFYAGFMTEADLQYNYNSKLSINLLSTFKYALTPITKYNVVKTYPYSFGIGAGVTYKF